MEAIKPGSSASLRAFSERHSLRVAEREHYQQEFRRIQPSPPPSYPPPQLTDTNHAPQSPHSPQYAPQQQVPPTFTLPPDVKPPKNFDLSKSWHGRPNVYRNADVTQNNSLPSPDEMLPQPYLDPEQLPPVLEHSTDRQRSDALQAPAAVPYDIRTVPRSFERPGNQFAHTNGGPHPGHHHQRPQPHQRRHGASFTKSSTTQDIRSPPPKPPERANTDVDMTSPTQFLDENDDPYQMMLTSPVHQRNKEAVDSSHSMKPKPKPKPRSRKAHSPNSSPKINLASPPARQLMISNAYVELLGDSGARVEADSTPTNTATNVPPAVDVMSSLNRLQAMAGGMKQSESDESGGGVVPEDLAQSFTSSQLQLLINMLQKVQAVQSPQGSSNGEGGEGGGTVDVGGEVETGMTPTSPAQGSVYEVDDVHDHVALKGNFSKLISSAKKHNIMFITESFMKCVC